MSDWRDLEHEFADGRITLNQATRAEAEAYMLAHIGIGSRVALADDQHCTGTVENAEWGARRGLAFLVRWDNPALAVLWYLPHEIVLTLREARARWVDSDAPGNTE